MASMGELQGENTADQKEHRGSNLPKKNKHNISYK